MCNSSSLEDNLMKLKFNQKINNCPGMSSLLERITFSKILRRMQSLLPHKYDFIPETYIFPQEYSAISRLMKDHTQSSMLFKANKEFGLKILINNS